MRRFYISPDSIENNLITITGQEARHMAMVLRLKPDQQAEFFDGLGGVHTATLVRVEKQQVVAEILASREERDTSPAPLTLAQCLLKGKKMDLVVQKATELGVHTFLPLVSRYCENRGERNPIERWQRIMIEACKQSHRVTPMRILPVTPLDAADYLPYTHRLVAWEAEQHRSLPTDFVEQPGPICLLLGPEGGIHQEEIAFLQAQHFSSFSLGPRILRGETAALASVSIVQYLCGALDPECSRL